ETCVVLMARRCSKKRLSSAKPPVDRITRQPGGNVWRVRDPCARPSCKTLTSETGGARELRARVPSFQWLHDLLVRPPLVFCSSGGGYAAPGPITVLWRN